VLKSSKNVFAYLRSWKEEQVIVALNFLSENISADLKLTGKAKAIHSNRRRINEICRLQNLELCSYEALILKLYE
jgi:alpha-glucosidase